MTWHNYFRLATPAGWESALDLEHQQEHKHETKLNEVNLMEFDSSMLKNSRFLTKTDCGDGLVVTIASIDEVNVAPEGEKPERKWTVRFKEDAKPLVLNSTNGDAISEIADGTGEAAWIGTRIELYHEPNVRFGRERKGGIRVRAPAVAPPAPAAPAADAKFDDDIPF